MIDQIKNIRFFYQRHSVIVPAFGQIG